MTSTQHKRGLLTIVNILSLDQLEGLRQNVEGDPEWCESCPKACVVYATYSKRAEEEQDKIMLEISQACHDLWPEHPATGSKDRCPCFRGVPPEEVLRTIDGAISLKKEIYAAKKNT